MRILMLTTSYPVREDLTWGPFVRNIARSLTKAGHEVEVVTMTDESESYDFFDDEVSVRCTAYSHSFAAKLHSEPGLLPSLAKHPSAWYQLPMLCFALRKELKQRIEEFKPDIVHAHWLIPGGLIAKSVCKKSGVPLVSTGWGADLHLPDVPPIRTLIRSVGKSRITVVSGYLKERCLKYGLREHAVSVIPNAVDTETFEMKEFTHCDELRIGIVSRLIPRKNVPMLLATLKAICEKHPSEKIAITVVGDGPLRGEVEKLCDEFPPECRPTLLSAVDHQGMPNLFKTWDVLLHGGTGEGLPTVVLEAMACGTPVVAPQSPFYDGILDASVAYIADELSIDALSHQIEEVLANPEQLKVKSIAGRKRIEDHFSTDAVCEQYESLYRSCLS